MSNCLPKVRTTRAPSETYDVEILQKLKERHPATQLLVWEKERSYLTRLAISILRSHASADALMSDVFCDFFYHYVQSLEKASAIRPYLRIMVVRRARRKKQKTDANYPVGAEEDFPAAVVGNPEEQIDLKLWSQSLDRCLDKLTPRSRTVLKMYYTHDYKMSEIGNRFGQSRQGIHRLIKCCHASLMQCLKVRRKNEALARKYHAC